MKRYKQVVKGIGFETSDMNFKNLKAIDENAKRKGSLLWRYIEEPHADGYAYYQIVKVNKKSVRIVNVTLGGDDWMIPYWGEETTIDIEYAKQSIKWRDGISKLFKKAG